MSTRVIKLKLLTQTDLVSVQTSARTFGEFKEEKVVKDLGIDWSSAKLIDRASKVSFDLDESVLPAINALMFVTPTKTKSGLIAYKEVKSLIKDFKAKGGYVPFNYTQATTAQLNEFWDSLNRVTEVVDESETCIRTPVYYESDLAELLTKDQLDSEAKELKEKF